MKRNYRTAKSFQEIAMSKENMTLREKAEALIALDGRQHFSLNFSLPMEHDESRTIFPTKVVVRECEIQVFDGPKRKLCISRGGPNGELTVDFYYTTPDEWADAVAVLMEDRVEVHAVDPGVLPGVEIIDE